MPDFHGKVIIDFVTKTATGIKDIDELRKRIDALKKEIGDLQSVTKESYDVVVKALIDRQEAILKQSEDAIKEFEDRAKARTGTPKGFDIDADTIAKGLTDDEKSRMASAIRNAEEAKAKLQEYAELLRFATPELARATAAQQTFLNSFKTKPLEDQIKVIDELRVSLRNTIQTKGIDVLDRSKLRAVENVEVKKFAQERIKDVPRDLLTGVYEPSALRAAKSDISEYRTFVREQLSKIVADYKKSQQEIKAGVLQLSKDQIAAANQEFNAKRNLKKLETEEMLRLLGEQREAERQGLSGEDLKNKVKEQADAAKAAYLAMNEEYKRSIQERITLSQKAQDVSSGVTKQEVEDAKKREEALKLERDALKKNADSAEREYKRIGNASKEASKFSSFISGLGNIAKYVFGTIFGVTVLGIVRQVTRELSEAGKAAIDYSKVLFTLNLAVRNMQRQGQPTSLVQIREEMQALRKEFNFFSELELSRAFAETTNKLSNLGYSAEQVANVIRSGIIVYITDLNGRFNDLGEAINGVTNYLASGYGEALERSGFIAGRAGDKLLAFEKGLGQSLASLNPLALSQERYNLLMAQTIEKSKDAAAFTETLAGQYKKAQADIVNANLEIGKSIDIIIVKWEQAKAAALGYIAVELSKGRISSDLISEVDRLADGYVNLTKQLEDFQSKKAGALKLDADPKVIAYYDEQIKLLEKAIIRSEALFESLIQPVSGGEEGLKNYLDDVGESITKISEIGAKNRANLLLDFNFDINNLRRKGTPEQLQELLDDISTKVSTAIEIPVEVKPVINMDEAQFNAVFTTLYEKLYEIQKDYNDRSIDLWNDYVEDVGGELKALDGTVEVTIKGKLELDYEAEVAKIEQEFLGDIEKGIAGKLTDAENDYQKKLDEAQKDYQLQLAQTIRDFNIKRAQLDRNYRLKELQAEREFQEELRKLREGFLLDLEDALRERDALQVIRLSREYTLQKEQAQRQFDLDKQTRKEQYEEEKKQLEIERQERLTQLYEELQARLEAIELEKIEERKIAEEEHKKALEEAKARYDAEVAERNRRYALDQAELERETKGKVDAFFTQLEQEGKLTEEFIKEFGSKLEEFLGGKNSTYDNIMTFFEDRTIEASEKVIATWTTLSSILAGMFKLNKAGQDTINKVLNRTGGGGNNPKRYWGGTVVATKPTTVTFGENEPEFIEFTPLSKLSKSKAMDIITNPKSTDESKMMAMSKIDSNRTNRQSRNDFSLASLRNQGSSSPLSYSTSKESMIGKFIFEMLLSPDLEARIVEHTLGQTADVFFDVLREQR